MERLRIAVVILLLLTGCSAPSDNTEPAQPVGRMLVLPHHDIASPMVDEALEGFEEQRVVLLSPHHSTVGPPFITAMDGYDQQLTDRLTALGAQVRDDLVADEWGVTQLLPYFEQRSLAVGALSALAGDTMLDAIADEAARLVGEGCLVIFSLDFSHGLDSEEADRRDDETMGLIMSGLPAAVKRLDSEYVDSPSLLYVAMEAGRQLGFEAREAAHANAADFIEVGGEVTSYFVIEWAPSQSLTAEP